MVFGPYSSDELVYKSDRVVEYRTPPRLEGLGTITSRLKPSDRPIGGVATLLGELPRNRRAVAERPASVGNDVVTGIDSRTIGA